MLSKTNKSQIQKSAADSLKLANMFFKNWVKTKDIASGRMAISGYNTVLKANQLLIDEGRMIKKPAQVKRTATRKIKTIKRSTKKRKK